MHRTETIEKAMKLLLAGLLSGLLLFLTALPAPAREDLVNLNTATASELKKLPFIGKARAEAIIRYRNEHGGIRDVEELKAAAGIGEDTLSAIRPYVAVAGNAKPPAPQEAAARETVPPPTGFAASPTIRVGTTPGEVRVLADEAYFKTLIPALREAKRSIRLAMFIFKSGERRDNRPAQVEKELVAARGRGVEVEAVLERSDRDDDLNRENGKVIRALQKSGVKARFDAGSRTAHAKIVVVDGRYCFVGSHNFTHAALAQNRELTLLIDSEPLARELEDYIRGL